MMKSKKEQLSRRAKIVELIKSRPGITSGEIAEKLALDNSTKVSTAIWPEVRAGRILVERINRTRSFNDAPQRLRPADILQGMRSA
ncbi:hypothetical protein ACVCII_18575 [Burkholderia glumae]